MGSELRERDCAGRHDYQYDRPYTAVRDADFLQVDSSDMEVLSVLQGERVMPPLGLERTGEGALELEMLGPRLLCLSSVFRCVLVLVGLDVMNEQGKARPVLATLTTRTANGEQSMQDPRAFPMLWELSQSVERVPGASFAFLILIIGLSHHSLADVDVYDCSSSDAGQGSLKVRILASSSCFSPSLRPSPLYGAYRLLFRSEDAKGPTELRGLHPPRPTEGWYLQLRGRAEFWR